MTPIEQAAHAAQHAPSVFNTRRDPRDVITIRE
jgi:hypothetical protein